MKTKKCYTCQTIKPLEEFNKNKCKKDGLNSICKKCSRKRSKQYYQDNKEKHRKETQKRRIYILTQNKEWIRQYKLDYGCKYCDEKEPSCLVFHHITNNKEKTISRMIGEGYGLKKIQLEISKCIVVCANCHHKIHAGILN